MSYFDTVNKAIELTVITDEFTGVSYLEPRYRVVLEDNDVHLPGHALPGDAKDQELWEILKLEVEKRNAMFDFMHPVGEWMYQVIAGVIDTAMTNEENDLIKNVTEYLKTKNQEKENEKKDAGRQEEKKGPVLPKGINFAKRTK